MTLVADCFSIVREHFSNIYIIWLLSYFFFSFLSSCICGLVHYIPSTLDACLSLPPGSRQQWYSWYLCYLYRETICTTNPVRTDLFLEKISLIYIYIYMYIYLDGRRKKIKWTRERERHTSSVDRMYWTSPHIQEETKEKKKKDNK
jgi:hypothetical protein